MVGFKTRKDGRVFPTAKPSKAAISPVVFARHPENLSAVQRKKLSVSQSPRQPNAISVRELEVYSTNDYELYKSRFVPIVQSLEKKREKGTYDRDKARIAFMSLVDDAAKKYRSEFGRQSDVIFSRADRLAVAGRLERDYIVESDLGNYKNMKTPQ